MGARGVNQSDVRIRSAGGYGSRRRGGNGMETGNLKQLGEAWAGRRFCPECPGVKFKNLGEHAEHLATHNFSPAQWMEAHERIKRAEARNKLQRTKSETA